MQAASPAPRQHTSSSTTSHSSLSSKLSRLARTLSFISKSSLRFCKEPLMSSSSMVSTRIWFSNLYLPFPLSIFSSFFVLCPHFFFSAGTIQTGSRCEFRGVSGYLNAKGEFELPNRHPFFSVGMVALVMQDGIVGHMMS